LGRSKVAREGSLVGISFADGKKLVSLHKRTGRPHHKSVLPYSGSARRDPTRCKDKDEPGRKSISRRYYCGHAKGKLVIGILTAEKIFPEK